MRLLKETLFGQAEDRVVIRRSVFSVSTRLVELLTKCRHVGRFMYRRNEYVCAVGMLIFRCKFVGSVQVYGRYSGLLTRYGGFRISKGLFIVDEGCVGRERVKLTWW